MSLNRFGADVTNIPLAWKRLEEALAEHDPKLLATVQPGAKLTEHQSTTRTWFGTHDGQKKGARPIFRGFRLLPFAEAKKNWDLFRGRSYRPDWDDTWRVVGKKDATTLLCYEELTTSVYEVDVSGEKYEKARICFGMAKWLDLARASLK